ncbi:MAG TPA: response regulator [bacterium]|nr:response regulator [bacterium]HOL48162.1 response regulator [bacterium]HPQ17763.1 response regulator [bacterium]
MNVLIVDDDKNILEMLKNAFLFNTDYNVIVMTNPIEAFDYCCKEKVDVLITDLMMPEMNGIDLIKKVKERNGIIQIIAITGYARLNLVTSALRRGAFEIFLKPFSDVNVLIDCVRDIEKRIARWKVIIAEIISKEQKGE